MTSSFCPQILFFSLFLVLPLSAEAEQSLFLQEGNHQIEASESYHTVVLKGGELELFGEVQNLIVINAKVEVRAGARVLDNLLLIDGSVTEEEGSSIPAISSPNVNSWTNWGWNQNFTESFRDWGKGLVGLLMAPIIVAVILSLLIFVAIIGFVLMTIAPGLSELADRSLHQQPLASIVWGVLSFPVFVLLCLLLTFSLLGIPLIPFVAVFFILLILSGIFAVCRALGRMVLERFGRYGDFAQILVGLLLFLLLSSLPIVGQALLAIAILMGSGAMAIALFQSPRARIVVNRI